MFKVGEKVGFVIDQLVLEGIVISYDNSTPTKELQYEIEVIGEIHWSGVHWAFEDEMWSIEEPNDILKGML